MKRERTGHKQERLQRRHGDATAIEAAFRWHPEWRSAFREGSLDEPDERHLTLHAAVEGMLTGDPNLSSVAAAAEQQGTDPHEVRHCLARALLFGIWYNAQEGIGYDADVMIRWFKEQLNNVG